MVHGVARYSRIIPCLGRISRLRVVVLAAALIPLTAQGQMNPADDPDKLSNDNPSRPLQMPAASSETKEAFEDFERFAKRGAWERATKALYAIPEAQAQRFVDGADGFIIPVALKRRSVLAGMSPEGQAAYRLFYDADAKKLLDQAEGSAEQSTLEQLFSAYFLTTVGDNAADRLGDLYFEKAQYDRAADCWLAILRERTDSEIPPALLTLKAAAALKKAGRTSELAALRAEILGRFADETVTLAGRKEKAPQLFRDLIGEADTAARSTAEVAASLGPAPLLTESIAPSWQVRFGDSVKAGMTPLESQQWEVNALSGAVPPVAISGPTLFANYLNHVFAIDLATGKMLWRSQSFHNVEINAMQTQMIDPKRFSIIAAPGFVWSVGRDIRDQNYMSPFTMSCRRSENGEVVWNSVDIREYANMDLVGLPILVNNIVYMIAKSTANNGQDNQPHQFALAIRPHDGKILWKTDVGTFREAQQQYYYAMMTPTTQPRLMYRAGSIYLDTHVGVLAKLDAESGALDWGFGYPTELVQSQGRFFVGNMPAAAAVPLSTIPFQAGDAFLVKGAKSDHLCALDPDRMKLLWDRPIARSARILGADDRAIYLGGPELGALDRQSRVLRWSTPLPGGSEDGAALVRPDGLWQLTSRGTFEVDPESGHVRKIFRGDDAGATGGDLLLTERWLLAVSNRTISAYPRTAAGAEHAAASPDALNHESRGSDD